MHTKILLKLNAVTCLRATDQIRVAYTKEGVISVIMNMNSISAQLHVSFKPGNAFTYNQFYDTDIPYPELNSCFEQDTERTFQY
jgi:hypothetical protein